MRTVVARIYALIGLCVRLEGVSGAMIRKALEDNLSKIKEKTVKVVDYERNAEGKMEWIIRDIDKSGAMDLFDRRLAVISPRENN